MNEIEASLDLLRTQVTEYVRICNHAVDVHLNEARDLKKRNIEIGQRNIELFNERAKLADENDALTAQMTAEGDEWQVLGAVAGFAFFAGAGLAAAFMWCVVR